MCFLLFLFLVLRSIICCHTYPNIIPQPSFKIWMLGCYCVLLICWSCRFMRNSLCVSSKCLFWGSICLHFSSSLIFSACICWTLFSRLWFSFLLSANALQMDNTSSGEFNWSPQRGESGETFFLWCFLWDMLESWYSDCRRSNYGWMDRWIDRSQRWPPLLPRSRSLSHTHIASSCPI